MRSDEIAECIMELSHEDDILDRMVRINLKNVNRSAYRSIDQESSTAWGIGNILQDPGGFF